MSAGQIFVVLGVALVTFAAVAALRRMGIPAPVVLVVAGLAIGFLPFVPDVSLPPELVLLGLLPLLVFDTAITSSPTAFRREWRTIGALAVFLVIATAFAVAAAAHWIAHLSWPMAFVLGTAVGPTDAAAATSVARRLRLPRRLITVLEGEALFNDATALVLYGAAVTAATSGRISLAHTAADVLYAVVVGAGIGLLVGIVGRWMLTRIDDPPIEIAGSILLAYVSYLPAEEIHASGVLAAVTAGLYLGWHRSGGAASAKSRLQFTAFWETLVFLVNAALFILVGLSFHTFSTRARGPLGRLTLAAVAVVGTVIIIRMVWMWAFARPTRFRRPNSPAPLAGTWRERTILGWAGMRGAITLAALLAVPTLTQSGHLLRGREEIVYLGFAVILATLVGQGMTLPPLVRRLSPAESPSLADAERDARRRLAQGALELLDDAEAGGEVSAEVTDGLRAQYVGRLQLFETTPLDDAAAATPRSSAASERALRLSLVRAQRRQLIALRSEGKIGATTVRKIERDLDLEEARLDPGGD